MNYDFLDDFAGPGGWDEGARMVGLTGVGLEWDHAACQTAVAAGHARIRTDVAVYPSAPFTGIRGYIASPPCQAWSMAGKRKGELDRANCHTLADRMANGDDSTDWTDWEDPRSPLVCQPVRRVRELRPEWIALEEVPAVLGLWQHFGRLFRGWGYSVWVGVLNAADYGVPQTRQRCILMASRIGLVQPPEPTHSRDGDESDLFGVGRQKWVTFADALGWGMTERPSYTIVCGSSSGGPDPLSGGSGARKALRRERDEGRWIFDRPATTTIVGSFRPDIVSAPGYRTQVSRQDAPGGITVTEAEAGALQSFPTSYPWTGSKSAKFRQVGNAIPPLLAAHILAALTGQQMRAAA